MLWNPPDPMSKKTDGNVQVHRHFGRVLGSGGIEKDTVDQERMFGPFVDQTYYVCYPSRTLDPNRDGILDPSSKEKRSGVPVINFFHKTDFKDHKEG